AAGVPTASTTLAPLTLALSLEATLFRRDPSPNQQLHYHRMALSRKHCSPITENTAARGLWWRAPLTFLSFHFLRHFPAIAGSLPAHTPRLEPLVPEEEPEEPSGIPALEQQEKAL